MNDIERQKTRSVFEKIFDREPLSSADFERLINFFEQNDIIPDLSDQARWAALQVRWRGMLHTRFMPKQGG